MTPTGPVLGDRKVWTSVVLVLVTSWALWISSFSATRTPRPRLPGEAAILTASRRLKRSIRAFGGGRPHGANEHDGLVGCGGQIEEERGLFHCIGAMGHNYPADAGVL